MKYTTKELMSMPQEEIDSICKCQCETKHCLFKKSLWKYRVDGFCLTDTILIAKDNIDHLTSELYDYKERINDCKEDIKFNEKRIKAIEKELQDE